MSRKQFWKKQLLMPQLLAAGALLGADVADVARAEANHRTRFLHEGGVHELAHLAGFEHVTRVGVNRLNEDLVLHDVQAVLRLAHGRAGAVDVGEAEEVDHLRAPQLLDRLTCRLDGAARPRLLR